MELLPIKNHSLTFPELNEKSRKKFMSFDNTVKLNFTMFYKSVAETNFEFFSSFKSDNLCHVITMSCVPVIVQHIPQGMANVRKGKQDI